MRQRKCAVCICGLQDVLLFFLGKIFCIRMYIILCMRHDELYNAIEQACLGTKADIISLSGGLDSSIIAYVIQDRHPTAMTVIAEEFVSTDLTYTQMVSHNLGMKLHLVRPAMVELLEGARQTIRILGNFNDIEIRNSLVMYFVIQNAKRLGADRIITGDGADEIFAGYDFLLKTPKLGDELQRLRKIMHFTSHNIGEYMGVQVESPFLDHNVMEVASTIPPEQMIGRHKGEMMGKMILRQTFQDLLPPNILWREKSPMQNGAGTAGLTKLMESVIPDDTFDAKTSEILKQDNIQIRTKESLFYYEQYKDHFGVPKPNGNDSKTCPYCKCSVHESKFCRMCGAFPV